MTFNDWYETYERDGGELMLFNTIDMEAAYTAGMEHAVEIADKIASVMHEGPSRTIVEMLSYGIRKVTIKLTGAGSSRPCRAACYRA